MKPWIKISLKVLLSLAVVFSSIYIVAFLSILILMNAGIVAVLRIFPVIIYNGVLIPLIWIKEKKTIIIVGLIVILLFCIAVGINLGINKHEKSLKVNLTPNINIEEYMPFTDDSKIVKYDNSSLKLNDNLPKLDGAAAVFPVYSAFVNAVYPENTELIINYGDDKVGPFNYYNTVSGYRLLGEKKTDIFFGAYPSTEQIEYAKENDTEFKYTQIGSEAFVFFVNEKNPIDNLTTQQIKDIYSGKITNWKDVGGPNEKIIAYQRNEGSGSQSMLKRFMGDTEIMEAPTEQVNDFMMGITEKVADYKAKPNAIGFSFRYYMNEIVNNPKLKIISVDGVYPSIENIKNGTYSITTGLYAVTYEGNENENIDILLDWVLSDEGQYIIEKTGYVGING